MAKAELWKAMAHLHPNARPFEDYVAVEEADGSRPFTKWNLPGSPPTETEITAAAAAYDAAEATRKTEAAAVRTQIIALAQSGVGTRVDLLTAGQVRALFAVQLWKAGALDTLLRVRPLGEWVKD